MRQKKSKRFFINAVWSEGPRSNDSHQSFEHAEAICLRLLWDYGNKPYNIRGYCKKVYVTDQDGFLYFEKNVEDEFKPSYAR